ncbi:MAG: tRNA pseudouridine synthase A [Micavibrio sp.]|nr:MAG: tRNA pseudouridine synthase A [Micavibrio sp.]
MTRYKLTIEYKGTDYAGWQRQDDVPTVQQAIEEAIASFSQQDVKIHAAGRTDAGVHAKGQVAHVDLDKFSRDMEPFEIAKAINAFLRPQPITIVKVEEVSDDFESRFHAKNKLYQYRLLNRPAFPAIEQGLVWHIRRPLDVEAMKTAAQILIGYHDFSTFRDSQCQAKSPEKTLARLDVTARDYDAYDGQEIIFEAEGRSFLHHQVRNMVGTLTLVGEGKWSADDLKAALEARDRTKGGPTAPSDGLYLVRIDYP